MTISEMYANYVHATTKDLPDIQYVESAIRTATKKYPYELVLEERFENGFGKYKAVFADGSEIKAFTYRQIKENAATRYRNKTEHVGFNLNIAQSECARGKYGDITAINARAKELLIKDMEAAE